MSSLPQYHWLLFHHIAEEIQISSFFGTIFAYDALVVVLLLLGQSCLLLFSSFFFISLVYYLKCPAVTLFILLHCSADSHQVAPVGSFSVGSSVKCNIEQNVMKSSKQDNLSSFF